MSGQWKGAFGASRVLAQAAGVIASRPPAVDKIFGTLGKKSAGSDNPAPVRVRNKQTGRTSRRQTIAGFTDPQIDTRSA